MKIFFLLLISSFLILNVFAQKSEIDPPIISKESGFYTDEFNLEITHSDGATILYTLDGSTPTVENKAGIEWHYKKNYPTNPTDEFEELLSDTVWTYKYSVPISIKNRENEEGLFSSISTSVFDNLKWREKLQFDPKTVFKGVVLKVVAYSEGQYSEVITRNYFITPQGNSRYSLPIVCISGNPIDIYDYENGLFVPGKDFDEWRTNNPNNQIFNKVPANYLAKGSETEFEINFEFIKDGISKVNQNVGLRGNGNSSRVYPNKSLRLYAKKDYGKKTINFPFFDNYPIHEFKRLILRNNGQDTEQALLRDAFLQESFEDLNVERQRQIPVIVFINAEYNGIYYLLERYDKKHFNSKFNIEEEDLDFLNAHEVKEGDLENFEKVIDFVESSTFEIEENYNLLSKKIDIENYTDYIIAQVYSGNMDWPHSNTDFWRKRTDFNPKAPFGHDGRWRWVFKDFDLGFGQMWISSDWYGNEYKINYLERAINNEVIPLQYTIPILVKLLENKNYKNYFINRFCDLLNTSFKESIIQEKLNKFKTKIELDVEEFVARWNPTNTNPYLETPQVQYPIYSMENWKGHIEKMDGFARNRPTFARKNLQDYFDLKEIGNLTLEFENFKGGYVELNSITIKEDTKGIIENNNFSWEGKYFTDIPITVKAIPNEGYRFSHWGGDIINIDSIITLNVKSEMKIIPHFINNSGEVIGMEDPPFIYPNPFYDNIYLLTGEYKDDFYVFTLDGKIIEQNPLLSNRINLSHLSSGVYLFSFKYKGKKIVKKIIKL